MHKYEELEKKYYKKQFLKYSLLIIILVLIGIGIDFILKSIHKNQKPIHVEKNLSKKIIKSEKLIEKPKPKNNNQKENNISVKNTIQKNDTNITKNKLPIKKKIQKVNLPILTFILPEIEETNISEKKKIINENEVNSSNKESNLTKNNTSKNIKKELNNSVIPKQKISSNLIIEEEVNINDLIKEFNENPDFDLAIQISKYYLKNGNLNLAQNWALKANSINPNRYESWKIFAIILLKENKTNKAKEVLKTYINDYGENEEINKLLKSIK